MANIKGTCDKDDINILARACVCMRARVCECARVRVYVHGEREACVPASVPREAAALSVSFVFITTVSK